ncbi:MAG: hypothetical protein ACYDH9_22435 [Limisphaerales bacterium]
MRYKQFFPLGAAVVAAWLLSPATGFAQWPGSDPVSPPSQDILNEIKAVLTADFHVWLAQGHVVMNPPQFMPQAQGTTNAAQTNIVLTLLGPPGQTVDVMRSTNLVDWSAAGSVAFDTNYSGTFSETMSNTTCFYQAQQQSGGVVVVVPIVSTNIPPSPITGGEGGGGG